MPAALPATQIAQPATLSAAPTPAAIETGEVVVTGRGLDRRPGDRAFDIVELDRDRIAASASNRLESVLADVAGLQQFRRSDSRSANPTSQGLSLRGLGGNASSRALLILDGVPQADPFGGWVAFPAYATGRLGLIRVTRGGGSGYFGAGALAGTIELESATPAQLADLEGNVAYGSRDAVEAQGAALLRRGRGFATMSGSLARGDGFVPVIADQRGPVDRAAAYRSASAAVRGVIEVGGATELQANLSGFTDRRERGTALSANRSQGADASVRLVGRGHWRWAALGYLQTRDFASEFAAINAARTNVTPTLDQVSTPASGLGARIEIAPPLGTGLDLRLGADWRRVDGETQELYNFVSGVPTRRRTAGGMSRTTSLFADGSARAGDLTLTLGGRLDRWRIADGGLLEQSLAGGLPLTNAAFADRTGREATGRTGIAWQPVRALTLRAAGYRGWRLPTLNELYRPFRVGTDATAANPALAPERLRGADVGIQFRPRRALSLAATVFATRLGGAIVNVTAGAGPGTFPGVGFVAAGGVYRVRQNVDAVRSHGIELDATWTGGAWFARGSWSHSDARVRASGAAAPLDGLRPAQTPRDLGSGTVGWRRGEWQLSGTVRHAARQFEDDLNQRPLAAATTLDGYAALPLTGGLALEVRAENATNTRVEAGVSGAGVTERATPRTVWVGLRFRGK